MYSLWAGEVDQQFKTFVAFVDDLGLLPSTYGVTHKCL